MSSTTTAHIIGLFEEHNLSYTHLTHETIPPSSSEASRIRNTPLERGAKALIVRGNSGNIYQFVIPADKRLDMRSARKLVGEKNLSLAHPDYVHKLTDCRVGSVPPTGVLWDIPVYLDTVLLDFDWIVFSAGTHTDSITCHPKALQTINKATVTDISKAM